MIDPDRKWLDWARELHALAAADAHYAHDEFERVRAARISEIAAEIVSSYSQIGLEEVKAAFEAQPGYVTPKVDVRGAVFEGDQLLMVREAMDGGWTLPGGWAEVGECPSSAVEREVEEEAGIVTRATRLVGVYDANRVAGALPLFHAYKLVFLCERLSGSLSGSIETEAAAFFPLNALPHPFSNHRTTPRHIADVLEAVGSPNWKTVFD